MSVVVKSSTIRMPVPYAGSHKTSLSGLWTWLYGKCRPCHQSWAMIGSQSMHYYIDYTLAYHYTHDTGTCLGPTAKPKARSHRHRETRNEKTVVQYKISSSPILFLGTRKLDDFQDRQPTDFLPPRKILTNQREVQ